MRKLSVVVVMVCALVGAESAFAIGEGDPGEPELRTVQASLTVTPPAFGVVTGPGISCPGDCTEDLDYTESCELAGPGGPLVCTPVDPSAVTLAGSAPSGWAPDWTGCTSEPSGNCEVEVLGHQTVSVAWVDTGSPTVGYSNPPAIAGPSTIFTAVASDNAGVARVEFYVSGVLRRTDTAPPFNANLDLTPYAHGSSQTLKVIAFDTSGLASSNLALAPAHNFTVDRQTGLSSLDTPAALVNAAPALAFTKPADVSGSGVTCRTKRGAAVIGSTASCASPYTAQTAGDGSYTVELVVTDNVGNTATQVRSFQLDTTDPVVSITGGPAEGASLQGSSASFNFTGSDANGVTLTCQADGGAFGACSGADSHALNGLTPGTHTFTVRATDGAGNTTDASRTFTVESPPNTNTGSTSSDSTAGNPTTGGGSGAAAGPGETVRNAAAAARSGPRWTTRAGKTRVRAFVLTGLVDGVSVDITCKGKGCPFKARKLRANGAKLDITKLFKKRQLRAGTVIQVRVTFPDGSTRTFRYTTQKGKKQPKAESLTQP